jgi:hypothetical protein
MGKKALDTAASDTGSRSSITTVTHLTRNNHTTRRMRKASAAADTPAHEEELDAVEA